MLSFINRKGFIILLVAIISEIVLPFILGYFNPNYNYLDTLTSFFGGKGSQTIIAYKVWEIINGILFILPVLSIYKRYIKTSQQATYSIIISLSLYGITDCIFSAIFDYSASDIIMKIHSYSSGIGFIALFFASLVLVYIYIKEQNRKMSILLIIIALLSFVSLIIYGASRIPIINNVDFGNRGLWQKINLLFLYSSFLIIAIDNIFNNDKCIKRT